MDDKTKRELEKIRDVVLGGFAVTTGINRITCDCQNCHRAADHTTSFFIEDTLVERHLCREHFMFLTGILPQMEQSPPEFPLLG